MTSKKRLHDVEKERHFLTSFFIFSPNIFTVILLILDYFLMFKLCFWEFWVISTSFEMFFLENFMLECSLAIAKWNWYSIIFPVPTGTGSSLTFLCGVRANDVVFKKDVIWVQCWKRRHWRYFSLQEEGEYTFLHIL